MWSASFYKYRPKYDNIKMEQTYMKCKELHSIHVSWELGAVNMVLNLRVIETKVNILTE
jgi:hypothetical protein